ncbi:MAG: hypothetical protein V3S20_02840 [Dehalococcoidia bacterium]
MKLISTIGMYDLTAEELSVEDEGLVIQGKMGIWEARGIFTPDDIRQITRLVLRPRILLYLLTLPFRRGN